MSLGDGELDGADGDVFKEELHFQQLRAVVGKMQWDALSHEEKITFFYPGARKVGESVKLAKGTGKVIRREVTIRFGLEMAFRMEDGSIFGGEFFD